MRRSTPCRRAFSRATSRAGAGNIGGPDFRPGAFLRQADGDGAAARADLQDTAPAVARSQEIQHRLHQVLGLRPWDQHVPRHPELHGPELPRPGEEGYRLSAPTAPDETLEPGNLRVLKLDLGTSIEGLPRPAQHFHQEHLRVEPGGVDARVGEPGRGALQHTRDPRLAVAPRRHPWISGPPDQAVTWSDSAWWYVIRPSIKSLTPPSMTWSSLYRVRLIRWSVTRPWGKL